MEELKIYEEKRPWGSFRQFIHNVPSTVKILSINSGNMLSLQYHNHRTEFWRVISGHPIITIGENKIKASPGDEFKIEKLQIHRIEAPEDSVQILEVGLGNFDEEDIIRIEDKYGRN